MVSHKISKSCGIISRILNALDIKFKKYIYYRLVSPYLTYCVNVCSYLSNKFKNPVYSPKEVSEYTLYYFPAAPFERYLHHSKNPALDKLINQQESILTYKVIRCTYLLNDFLNHGDVSHQIQLKNNVDLSIPLYATTHSQLCIRYRAKKTQDGFSDDFAQLIISLYF